MDFSALTSKSTPKVPPKWSNAYRKLLSSIVQETAEQDLQAKASQLSLQDQWIKWCNFLRLDLSWKTMLAMPKSLLSFCLSATMTLCHLPQIFTDGMFIHNHLVIYAVKQCVQQLTFLVPAWLPFSREDSLTTMTQFCRLF